MQRRGTQSSSTRDEEMFLKSRFESMFHIDMLFYLENNIKYSFNVHLCLWMEHKHLMFIQLNNVTS